MPLTDFLFCLRLAFFLNCFSTLHASPSSSPVQPLVAATTSKPDQLVPYCFNQTSHPGIGTTNGADCRQALRLLASTPQFRDRTVYRFSKNARNGIRVPKGWQHGYCVIYVSCANDRDADYFSLVDISRAAIGAIKDCVDDAVVKYGGLSPMGNVGSFYVSVGRPVNPHVEGGTEILGAEATALANVTLVDAALGEMFDGDVGRALDSS